ncbi:MAG: pilus assembly protein [Acidobacteria bacterium]|nr:pilus assembly protein [Acidobacteriota bacterium]
MRQKSHTLRRRARHGAQLVEMALVMVPFLAILLAFFDVCMVMFRWTTLQNAVREGSRYAVTFRRMGGLGQDASIKQVVQNYSLGTVSATATNPEQISVNYYAPAAPNTPIAAPNGNSPGNIVEVSVPAYRWNWIAPLSGTLSNPFYATSPLSITVRSADILGGYPVGTNTVPR